MVVTELHYDQAWFNSTPIHLRLNTRIISYEDAKTFQLIGTSDLNCVVGAACTLIPEKHLWKLTVFRYTIRKNNPLTSSCISTNKFRTEDHLEFVFSEQHPCEKWANTISNLTSGMEIENDITTKLQRRRFLVVINPKAGQGKAIKIWQQTVCKMLNAANVEYKSLVTEGANHAYLYILSFDVQKYDAIITIGGDGTLAEVINALCNRDDAEDALDRVVLVPLGGGTGNGLIKSILFNSHEEYSVENALFCALKGAPQTLDLAVVQTQSKRYHSFLLLGWGLIADIDLLSEPLRWMGELRLHVAAVYFILSRRVYSARLSLLLTSAVREAPTAIPALGAQLSSEWEVIEGEFNTVMVLQTSHCATTVYSGPGVRLDDGVFTIQIVRGASRMQLLQVLLSIDSGEHVKMPFVKTYKAYAYRLEPLTSEGRYTLDGELVEYGPIQGLVMKKGVTTFKLVSQGREEGHQNSTVTSSQLPV